jgi:predicted aldo/keto reductase-like oxidoreductase
MDKEKIKKQILSEFEAKAKEIEERIRSLKSIDSAIESLKEEEKKIEKRIKNLFDVDLEGNIIDWCVRTNGQIRITEPIKMDYSDTCVSLSIYAMDRLYTDPLKLKKDKVYRFMVLAIPVEESD